MKHNDTVGMMRVGLLKFTKRMTVPLFHTNHITKAKNVFRQVADELERLEQSNSLRNVDKCIYSQHVIQQAHHELLDCHPTDPRERGAELGSYSCGGWMDELGHKELLKDDMFNDQYDRSRAYKKTSRNNTQFYKRNHYDKSGS